MKIGPGLNSNSSRVRVVDGDAEHVAGQHVAGELRRWKLHATERASACASVVLPTPGTSSISRWPRASRHTSDSRTTSGFAANRRTEGRLQFGELAENIGRKPNRRGHHCFPLGHYNSMILNISPFPLIPLKMPCHAKKSNLHPDLKQRRRQNRLRIQKQGARIHARVLSHVRRAIQQVGSIPTRVGTSTAPPTGIPAPAARPKGSRSGRRTAPCGAT